MSRKIAMIASTSFPLVTEIGAQIVDVIREYDDAVFLTRGSGETERFISHVCLTLDKRCFKFIGHGGGDNFSRDDELVAAADEVVAFLDPNVLETPFTGTKGVIDRALRAGKPVRAATPVEGNLVWVDA